MNLRILVATVVGGILFFVLGFLIYGMLLMNYMQENMYQYAGLVKEVPDMIPLVLANLVWAWLLAYIFDTWAGIRTFVSGAIAGGLLMLAIALAIDLQFAAFMNMYKSVTPLIVDVVVVTFMGAVTGGVIGLILGMMNKTAVAE